MMLACAPARTMQQCENPNVLTTKSTMLDSQDLPSDVSSNCTCSTLNPADIPGATLQRAPEKCKINELRVWLKSRGQRVKTKETKAELVVRVKKCRELMENLPLVDPYPGQPYRMKLKASCPSCSQPILTENKTTFSEPACDSWTSDTSALPKEFSYIDIINYSKKSGKQSTYVEKPLNRGYVFFHDGYVFGQAVSSSSNLIHIRANCYRSMKKNELPHKLKVSLSTQGSVVYGQCSCVAGAGGHCNHIYALLYSIDHTLKLKLESFPRAKTCTEKPAEWVKCRQEGVRSDTVMDYTVVKPKFGSPSKGIKSTLYEARGNGVKHGLKINETMASKLKNMNALLGVCLTAGEESPSNTTRMGFDAFNGSLLSYQLSATEGDFSVSEHVNVTVDHVVRTEHLSLPNFPWHPRQVNKVPEDDIVALDLKVTDEMATDIMVKTMKQSETREWFDARRHRLTASKFGAIIKRKKDKEKFVKTNLCSSKDLTNVPAVKFGRENESKAKQLYAKYMGNTNRPCKVSDCGCVINPNFPWLAASPDGIVNHKDVGYGLLEIKCCYSKRNITPLDACQDPTFFCAKENGNVKLKKEHEYYAQVQGQMGVCGAGFCDFIVYTCRGMSIERITFDEAYWQAMTDSLATFFTKYFVPVMKTVKKTGE